jgi:hypothetical protein
MLHLLGSSASHLALSLTYAAIGALHLWWACQLEGFQAKEHFAEALLHGLLALAHAGG